MKSWCPLWSVVVKSSLWQEPDHVVKVFMTMLALKDYDHVYRGNAFHLAGDSRKSEVEVLDALKVLASPDKIRKQKQEHDGRRIQAVEGGWLILNGEHYQKEMRIEMKKRRDRKSQAAFRQRRKEAIERGEIIIPKKPRPSKPLPGDQAHQKLLESGASQEVLDAHTESCLPDEGAQ